jgi:hypothetical protein
MILLRSVVVLFGVVAGTVVLYSAVAGPAVEASQQPELKKPRRFPPERVDGTVATTQAACRWAAQPPVLDGNLDDACWQKAAVIDRFGTFWTDPKSARPGTFAYLVWDDEALYYAGSMTDTELRSFGTRRNDTLWNADVFELFLKPSAEKPEYFEFQANPRALVFEMAFSKRDLSRRDFTSAPALGSKAVVALKGTLDQPGDRDEGWTVEGRIPWSAFAKTGGKPKPGDSWFFAICRYDYGPQGTKPVTMSSAPLTRPSFHQYEDYGKLQFEGPRGRSRLPQSR